MLGSLNGSLEGLTLAFELGLLLGVADLLGWSDGFLLGWPVGSSDFIDGWPLGSLDSSFESLALGGMLGLLLGAENGLLLGTFDSEGEALGPELDVSLGCIEGSVLGTTEFVVVEIMLGLELGAVDG